MNPQVGLLGVLKTSTHIVFLNLHHLLRVSALSILIVYVFKALAFPAAPSSTLDSIRTSIIVLGNVFIVLLVSLKYTTRDLRSYPTLNPNPTPHSCIDVISNLCFVFYGAAVANQLNAVYETTAIIIVCRNFAISAVLAVIAGAVYTVLTMCSLDKCYKIEEESRRWVDSLIMWCIDVVQTSKWVAGVAYGIAFWFCPPFEFSLTSWIEANAEVLSVMWRWVAAGVSVSLLPLLFVCAMSTHAALYLSCRTHHKKSSADTLISHRSDSSALRSDSSALSVDEEPTR